MKRGGLLLLPALAALWLLAACAAPAPAPAAPGQAAAQGDDDLLCRPWPAICE